MKIMLACAMALALGGCAHGEGPAVIKQFGEAFKNCEQHVTYSLGVGALLPTVAISGRVDCPQPAPAP